MMRAMAAPPTLMPSWAALVIAALLGLAGAALIMWPRSTRDPPAPAVGNTATDTAEPAGSALLTPPSVSIAPPEALSPPAASAAPAGAPCLPGMVAVEGVYCPFVAHRCEAFLGADPIPADRLRRRDALRRCERFADALICEGRPTALDYCIDRYEYPNIAGAKPVVMVSYHDAKLACAREGKRLCEGDEWIFACEGARTLPYPTGLGREPGTCNIDRRPRRPNERALATPSEVSVEVARLDQRMPSGSLEGCVSSVGAFDMSGNVAEWVHNREANPDEGISVTAIAGGHYARVPATCRLLDTDHDGSFADHRTGFRCCSDRRDGRAARRLMPRGFRLPKRRKLLE